MKYLLDANACIDHLRRGAKSYLTSRLRTEPAGNVCLCSVVRSELMYGAFRSRDPVKHCQEVQDFWTGFHSLEYDDQAADICGDVRAHLARSGTPIGPFDLMIAAIARANGLTVVTNNVAEFARVPRLSVEDWSLP